MLNFKFFVGVVEDTYDPMKINRVRVRCVGVHPESRAEVGVDDLPWAPMLSTTANMSAPMLHNGDWVFGFFMDGEEAQQPVVIGSIVSKPNAAANSEKGFNDPDGFWPQYVGEGTNSRLARNENVDDQTPIGKRKLTRIPSVTTADRRRWQEPETQYAAAYPMNKVLETESGHVLEFDDTPGRERVHIYHKSGTFLEMFPDGKVVFKAVNNSYSMTLGEHDVYASGAVNISAAGRVNVLANAGVNVVSKDGDINIRGKNVTIEAREKLSMAGAESLTASSGGKATIQSARDMNVQARNGALTLSAASPLSLSAPRINVSSSINLSRTPRARAQSLDIRSRQEPEVETYAYQRQDRVDRYRVTPSSAALEQPPAGGWPPVSNEANLPAPNTPPAPQPVTPQQPPAPDLECGSPPDKNSGLYLTLARDVNSALSQLRAHPNWNDAFRRGMDMIKQFEGFEANMYLDSVQVATIGWGFTDVALRAVRNDPRVTNLAFFRTYNGQLTRGMTISRSDADTILDVMVETIYMRSVLSTSTGIGGANVTPYMVMALTSFTFNLGAGNLQRSTLRRLTNECTAATPPATYATISNQFMQWTKAGGQVLRGLVRRRQAEKCLFVFAG